MQVDVHNIEHQVIGTIALPDDVFGAQVNEALLWEQVKAQRASRRRGTHETKTRADVRGGGAKPYKQKGTGRARQGSSRAPNHVGGGVVFGPHNRDYAYRLPRSGRRAALRSALSLRAASKDVVVVDRLAFPAASTKAALAYLTCLGEQSALLVDVDNGVLHLSTRNLRATKSIEAVALNVYDILDYTKLVLTRAAVDIVVGRARATRRGAADGAPETAAPAVAA